MPYLTRLTSCSRTTNLSLPPIAGLRQNSYPARASNTPDPVLTVLIVCVARSSQTGRRSTRSLVRRAGSTATKRDATPRLQQLCHISNKFALIFDDAYLLFISCKTIEAGKRVWYKQPFSIISVLLHLAQEAQEASRSLALLPQTQMKDTTVYVCVFIEVCYAPRVYS